MQNIADGLTQSVASDGQTPMSGALNMATNKINNLGTPAVSTDAATKDYVDTSISGLGSTYLAKANNLSDVTSTSTSRTNLGLGTIATQAASAVAVTGGTIDGTTVGTTTRSTVKATTLDLGLSTQSVAIGQGNASIMKNRIINGAMVIDQRNAGASVTPTVSAYSVDRWVFNISQASKFSFQQNAGSVTPPVGFTKYLGVTSLSNYSVLSTDNFVLNQWIEGYNIADLGWGTANAKTVTLSFQVYSSLTGTFGGSLQGYNGSTWRSYPFNYSIPVANTWTTISVTVAGDTTAFAYSTTNSYGINVSFSLGAGSTYSGTANAFTASQISQPTGSVSVVGTNLATFYITGVQLEVGSSATEFEYRVYSTELANCQRYYQKGLGSSLVFNAGTYNSAQFCVSMRTTPTVTVTPAGGSFTFNLADTSGFYGSNTVTSNASFTASAEL